MLVHYSRLLLTGRLQKRSKGIKWGEIPTKPPSLVFEGDSFTLTCEECLFLLCLWLQKPNVKDAKPYVMRSRAMFTLSDSEEAGNSLG